MSPGSYRCRLRYKDEVYDWIDRVIEANCAQTKVTWKNGNTTICDDRWQVSYGTRDLTGNQEIHYEVQFITGLPQCTVDGKVYTPYNVGKTVLQTAPPERVIVWKKSDYEKPSGCGDNECIAWRDPYNGTWALWRYKKEGNSWSMMYPLPKYL